MGEIRTIPPPLTDEEWNALLDHSLEKAADFLIRYSGGEYQAINGSTGIIDHHNADKDTVVQDVIDDLEGGSGGLIILKNLQLGSVTYGNTVLIAESYQGKLTYYRNNSKLREIGDCPVPVTGTHTHTNDTNEQTFIELTPSVVTDIYAVWIDVSNLTQIFTLKVYSKIDGTNYREIVGMRRGNVDPTSEPALCLKGEIMINTDWKITIQSSTAEGSQKGVPYRYFKEEF